MTNSYGEMSLRPGDRVLVRNVGLQGKQKLADRWAKDVYRVCKKVGQDLPVYVVKPESGGKEKTLHRNMLLPLQSLPRPRCIEQRNAKPVPRKRKAVVVQKDPLPMTRELDHSSDSEDEAWFVPAPPLVVASPRPKPRELVETPVPEPIVPDSSESEPENEDGFTETGENITETIVEQGRSPLSASAPEFVPRDAIDIALPPVVPSGISDPNLDVPEARVPDEAPSTSRKDVLEVVDDASVTSTDNWVRRSTRLQEKRNRLRDSQTQAIVNIANISSVKPAWEQKMDCLLQLKGVIGNMSNDNLRTVLDILQQ